MGTGVRSGCKKASWLQATRIRGVENWEAIAEHGPDVGVVTIDHHLNAVGTTALVAVRDVPDPAPDAFRRNRIGRRCRTRHRGKGRGGGAQQALYVVST